MREKIGKSRFTVFFQWFVAPEGRKVGSLKRRVRSQLARWERKNCTPLWREAHFQVKSDKTPEERTTFGSCDAKKCTPLWREAHFQVKMYKTHHVRTTFGSWDVEKVHAVVARSTCPSQNAQNTPRSDHFWKLRCEKVHAVVARSTFPSQNVQSTPRSDHFWKLRCRKSARRCGAKHISKSKCTKHTTFGPLLEVAMSKKCTPLWREAHFQVKMYKAHQCRTTFGSWDVEKVHAVVARSTFPSQNAQNTPRSDHFWKLRCRKKCTPLWREAHFQVKMYKAHQCRTTFGSWDVEKVHAVVARSTFPSQNVKNTRGSDHFWRFRCRKSVEKVHAVVARSTFRSQKCKKLRVLSLFWREDVEKVDTD